MASCQAKAITKWQVKIIYLSIDFFIINWAAEATQVSKIKKKHV